MKFEPINDSFLRGIVQEPAGERYGLYSADMVELIPPQYVSIERLPGDYALYREINFFHVIDSHGASYLFVDDPRAFLRIGEVVGTYQITCHSNASIYDTVFTIKEIIDNEVYYGSLLISENSVFLQVPVQYSKLIYGHFYIAAYERWGDCNHVFIYTYDNEERIEKTQINKPIHFPSEIKPEFDAILNTAVGFNEPYPIINGKVYLLGDELFDSVLPVGEEKPYCIVLKNGKYGIWEERHGDKRAGLVVDCEYDSITPYKASCPCSPDQSTLDAFSLERDGMWGIYYQGVFIPEVFEEQPEVVSSYFLDHSDLQWMSSPIGFICSRKKRYGVINWSGNVIIPFRYERIDPVGYMEDESSHIFYKAFVDREYSLFDKYGKDILGTKYYSIDFFQCHIAVFNRLPESFRFFICKNDGLLGLLDMYGNELLPFEYEEMRYNKDRRSIFVRKQRTSEYEEIKPDMSFVHYGKCYSQPLVEGVNSFVTLKRKTMSKPISHIKVYVHHMDSESRELDSGALHCEEFYDQKGRLIRRWHSDIWTTYTYDSEGRLCEEREKRSLGTRITIREYTPEGDLYHLRTTWEHPDYFDGEHYCICPDDSVEGKDMFDMGESEEVWLSWKALGRLCEHERITRNWDGSEERSYLEDDYDDKGNIIEERIYGEKRELLLKSNYTYSDKGVLLEKATVAYYEDNSVGEPYCKSVYDDKEQVIMHHGSRGHIMTFKFSDDEYGNWVLRNADIKDDSETEHLVFRRIIEYQNG